MTTVDDTRPRDAWDYEHLTWYPGAASVRRLKERYFKEHPQIRAHSSATAEAESDDDHRSQESRSLGGFQSD
jgi:hypothetical protein